MNVLVQAVLACLLSALTIVALRAPAARLRLIDRPDGRKRHGESVPVTGGLAILLAFFAALWIPAGSPDIHRVLLVVMVALGAVGLYDDRHGGSARAKLAAQIAAALAMTLWGNQLLRSFGDILGIGPIGLAAWSIPITVFATAAVVNGINMLDGLDGLAGGLVAVMLLYFALFAWLIGDTRALALLAALFGAVAGFLLFNAPHPWRGRLRTFMGDTGSLALGFAVAWFTLELSQKARAVPPVVMLWVAGVVLLDLFTVTVRRLLRGRNPLLGDRGHIHHLLLRRGMSPGATAALLVGANALLGAIGTAGWRLGVADVWLFAGFLVVGIAYLAVFLHPAPLMRAGARRRR